MRKQRRGAPCRWLRSFRASNRPGSRTRRNPTHSASAAVWDHPVQLHVRVLSVSDSAFGTIASALFGSNVGRRLARGCFPARRRRRKFCAKPGTKTSAGGGFGRTAHGGRRTSHQLSRGRQAVSSSRRSFRRNGCATDKLSSAGEAADGRFGRARQAQLPGTIQLSGREPRERSSRRETRGAAVSRPFLGAQTSERSSFRHATIQQTSSVAVARMPIRGR